MNPEIETPRDQSPRDEMQQVYARLRRIAGSLMRNERPGHTLWPTEVVNEALARVLESEKLGGEPSLTDLVTRVSHVMRQVLIDHARRRGAVKHGGGRTRVSLDQIDDFEAAIESQELDWAAMDRALTELAAHDPRRHQVVTLRFFGGLSNRQIARELKLDERTVGRDWSAARLWLKKQIQSSDG